MIKIAPRTDDDRRQHPYCQECKVKALAEGKDWSRITKKCHGVYSQPDFEYYAQLTGMTIDEVKEVTDPTSWVFTHVGMMPYWYQDRILRCTSIRRVLRLGRRTGKTQSITAYILFVALTNAGKKILCITPHKSQAKEINDRLDEFFNDNPALQAEVTAARQQPYYEKVFANGSRIRLFVAGSSSGKHAGSQVRGQEADFIFVDEMDYLDDDASAAILPILQDPERKGEPVVFIGSSTPTGRESTFYDLCHDSNFKEFHFPSSARPDWNEDMERESRNLAKTELAYEHEYLAEWGTKQDGVLKRGDVLRAMQRYRYHTQLAEDEAVDWPEMKPYPSHWRYMMGVDWNGPGNGTRIAIVGYDFTRDKFILVYREAVEVSEFSLSFAVNRIIELNRVWRCSLVLIDSGYGQMQDETLRKVGKAAQQRQAQGMDYHDADLIFIDGLVSVDFGGNIEYTTEEAGRVVKKTSPTKNFIVENLQRYFENDLFWFSYGDASLRSQFIGYKILRYNTHGHAIYGPDESAGDHDFDAVMLALYGFEKQHLDREKSNYVDDFVIVPYPWAKKQKAERTIDPLEDPAGHARQVAEEKENQYTMGVPSRGIEKEYDMGKDFLWFGTQSYSPPKRNRLEGAAPKPGSRTSWKSRGRRQIGGKRF